MVRISNLRLLRILEENSRIPFSKLAKMFGVSDTAIRKRIVKLEKGGIIKRYTVEIDFKKLGFGMRALIGIDTKSEHYIPVIEKLKGSRDIVSIETSSGDHMIIAEAWFKDHSSLTRFVKSVKCIEGVTKVCPAIILEKIK